MINTVLANPMLTQVKHKQQYGGEVMTRTVNWVVAEGLEDAGARGWPDSTDDDDQDVDTK
ncbi:hypothetical protein PHLCEN_2v10166 [Hermanssonia centrifuga]|uniref:Uncharacterized protein n=1 Tax=Hermanssonia centrifuga TaxID=98765 RepID=A0A2R6NNM7_9APHY|nr:hypothetical protein PHLCEN_2v10166 [Hermanssonia centrifuga]